MKAHTLLYHDIIEREDDESGFPGPAAARYKIPIEEFARQVREIVTHSARPAVAATASAINDRDTPFFVTVDDGGKSAMRFADTMDEAGYRATFFITTDRIGTAGFLSSEEIRALHRRGHAIGSHSHTHPYRFSELSDDRLLDEWKQSVDILADILQSDVETGSVPGGYYAPRVAKAARAAGIRLLFNSEPTDEVEKEGDCWILGRFNVYRGMSAKSVGQLAAANQLAMRRQQLSWNTKKIVKMAAAPVWERTRRYFFGK